MGVRKLFKKRDGSIDMTDRGHPVSEPDPKPHVRLNLNDLTVSFRHLDRETLLEDWEWLIGSTKLPIALTACGDAFVQDVNDGSVYLLDAGAGRLQQVAGSTEAFQSLLSQRDFVVGFFGVELVAALRASGCVLAPGQIYSLKILPCLGGKYVPSNMEPTDIEVHFSLWGDVHRQLAGLPEGTKVKGFAIEPPSG